MKALPRADGKHNSAISDEQGMDLRDWFAGLAMQSMNSRPDYEDVPASVIALDSYTLADEMMKARTQS